MDRLLLIDSHVHIHDCYNLEEFFPSVFENFSGHANKIDNSIEWLGVLFLAEIKGVNFFSFLTSSKPSLLLSNNFKFKTTLENNSLIVSNSEGKKIIIIAGKQIIAKDEIEVLALGTSEDFDDGNSLDIIIDKINNIDAIPILPWGVGKWLGKRKKIIQKFLENNNGKRFFLGDNSGRPSFWAEPDIYKLKKTSNHFVLPGSDALAIPSEVDKTASYGFYLDTKIDLNKPTEYLKNELFRLNDTPKIFGELERPFKFFKNQIIMQLNKRKKQSI